MVCIIEYGLLEYVLLIVYNDLVQPDHASEDHLQGLPFDIQSDRQSDPDLYMLFVGEVEVANSPVEKDQSHQSVRVEYS